ncbi:hypothetical protein GALMADRAFT_1041799 [Galerina marginata CBS 339.88]|uniref:Uncharacterized protein n=1 Tax=Galerina marginata (strain CBS 339.88) TaxID=685588 RepID=A0A067SBT2_GALM3|nr:hypothetical protein GALMADRAFT_1041799 [Galerina marginata CBS 339.88]
MTGAWRERAILSSYAPHLGTTDSFAHVRCWTHTLTFFFLCRNAYAEFVGFRCENCLSLNKFLCPQNTALLIFRL